MAEEVPAWYSGEGIYQFEWREGHHGAVILSYDVEWNCQAYIGYREGRYFVALRAYGGDLGGFHDFRTARKIEGSIVDFILDGGPNVNNINPIPFGMWGQLLERFAAEDDAEARALSRWVETFPYTDDVRLTRYLQDRARSAVHMETPRLRTLAESAAKVLRETYRGAEAIEEEREVHRAARGVREYREHVTLANVRRE